MKTDSGEDITIVDGKLVLRAAIGSRLPVGFGWDVTELAQTTGIVFPIPWGDWRETAAYATALPGTASGTNMGLVGGTFGTNQPSLRTADFKVSTTTALARAMVKLPDRYVAGSAISFRFGAGMITTVSDTSALLGLNVYRIGKDNSIGSQLCPTAAQSINSLSEATKTFSVTSATLNPGDVLDIQVSIAVVDGASGTAVIGAIFGADMLCTIQG